MASMGKYTRQQDKLTLRTTIIEKADIFLGWSLETEGHCKCVISLIPMTLANSSNVPFKIANHSKNAHWQSVYTWRLFFSDFTIHTANGTIRTVRYLLYLTIDQFRVAFDAEPLMQSMVVHHQLESMQQVRKSSASSLLAFQKSTCYLSRSPN